jgi:pimeloyl-ACP methyl ester carboxylesterase
MIAAQPGAISRGLATIAILNGPKRLWEISGSDHDSMMRQPQEIWQKIIEFWRTSARGY